ncbi:hypothetical protein O3M35_007936 [Rhynocoris fuscipes]|uniref:Pyrimidine nucleoside phosphorylase C-terminal domain-containing protein n=1 Tax=Rhynocoris fuscipes TaxID=488301 RepID=A0AAW1DGE0_9HEMI
MSGAMLMAIAINGLSNQETIALTEAMINSGKKLEWSGLVVDKHSTGGVGDKVSLVLAPALAACHVKVPMMSGRGLGLTGGTLDKLESIKGYSVSLSEQQMKECLDEVGCFIASTTDQICPGDKATYSYRDVTSTVDVIPLIVAAAKHLNLNLKCVISSMNDPIGRAVGNALEVKEVVACLKGAGPKDLLELVSHLGGELLEMCGKASTVQQGAQMILDVIGNGEALERFKKMCIWQGVSEQHAQDLCDEKFGTCLVEPASHIEKFHAKQSGWVRNIDGLPVAKICWELGSGRKNPEDNLDLSVGVILHVSAGDYICEGDCWAELHHNKIVSEQMIQELEQAIHISNTNEFIVPSRIIKTIV